MLGVPQKILYAQEVSKLEAFVDNGFVPEIPERLILLGGCKDDIALRFGNPIGMKTWTKPDIQEPGVINEYNIWKYDGLEITTVTPHVGDEPHTWLQEIVLTNHNYSLRYGLKLGDHKFKFESELGKPSKEKAGTAYYKDIQARAYMDLTIEYDTNGRAKKILWLYGSSH